MNFLDLLRAGHTDYVVNDAALSYMRGRALAGPVIARLAAHTDKQFADPAAWQAHLERLGITELTVTPEPADRLRASSLRDPMQIATEGALWGSIQSHDFLREGVIVSDDAGQFAVGKHALCWIHAERLVHKLDTFTDHQRAAQQQVRSLIWQFYADPSAWPRPAPSWASLSRTISPAASPSQINQSSPPWHTSSIAGASQRNRRPGFCPCYRLLSLTHCSS